MMKLGKVMVAALAIAAAFGLEGCGTTPVTLTYNSAGVPAKAEANRPVVEVLDVMDVRKNASSRLGTIRGGFGNPLKTIDASVPVRDIVRKAYVDALTARGLLAAPGTGQYGMSIAVKRLDSNQLVRREAHTQFDLTIAAKGNPNPVFWRSYADDRADDGHLAGGVLASTEDMRKDLNDSLQAAVDKALDDPALLAVLAASPQPAALAAPPQPAAPVDVTGTGARSSADRLGELQSLYDRKLITKTEYDERRRVILGAL